MTLDLTKFGRKGKKDPYIVPLKKGVDGIVMSKNKGSTRSVTLRKNGSMGSKKLKKRVFIADHTYCFSTKLQPVVKAKGEYRPASSILNTHCDDVYPLPLSVR